MKRSQFCIYQIFPLILKSPLFFSQHCQKKLHTFNYLGKDRRSVIYFAISFSPA